MTPRKTRRLVFALSLVGIVAAAWGATRYGLGVAARSAGSVPPSQVAQVVRPGQKITFLELGSEGCKPCEAMKPVMQAVRERHGGRVEVTFHDVRKDPSVAREWRIRLIPTQIFLRPDGTEFFRHEGYLPLEEVERVLAETGLGRRP